MPCTALTMMCVPGSVVRLSKATNRSTFRRIGNTVAKAVIISSPRPMPPTCKCKLLGRDRPQAMGEMPPELINRLPGPYKVHVAQHSHVGRGDHQEGSCDEGHFSQIYCCTMVCCFSGDCCAEPETVTNASTPDCGLLQEIENSTPR